MVAEQVQREPGWLASASRLRENARDARVTASARKAERPPGDDNLLVGWNAIDVDAAVGRRDPRAVHAVGRLIEMHSEPRQRSADVRAHGRRTPAPFAYDQAAR
jgi:hypothetical protein